MKVGGLFVAIKILHKFYFLNQTEENDMLNAFEPVVEDTINFVKKLGVKITETSINNELQNHPNYPSLLSISDCLHKWKVPNAAFKTNAEQLQQVAIPFLSFLPAQGRFATIIQVEDNAITYTGGNNQYKTVTADEFEKQSNGIVLMAELTGESGEKDYNLKKQKENFQRLKLPAVVAGIVIVALFAVLNIYQLLPAILFTGYALLTGLMTAGVFITSLLLYEVNKNNPALQKICTAGKKTNCNAVLSSKAAKLLGKLSWSEAGFFYFTGCLLLLLLAALNPIASEGILPSVSLLVLAALPYIFFSVVYQWRVAKQWCPLCPAVQAVLLLAGLSVITTGSLYHFQPDAIFRAPVVFIFLISFVAPVAFWYYIKPLLLAKQKAKEDFHSLQRIKFNPEIFDALLEKQKHVTEPTDDLGIVLGNANAENTLIKVCNPFCGPCAKAHPEIDKLLEENTNLKVQIIFMASADDYRTPPVKHLMAIAEKHNEQLTRKALDDWYLPEDKEYEVFARKYPLNGELNTQVSKINKMKSWCDATEITFTPTFFFNGKQLPNDYSVRDLNYFLSE